MEPVTLRVAFWNTWLLRPRLWPGGPPIPGGDRFFAPQVRERAPLVGAAVRGRFDVCAMSEVFDDEQQRSIGAAVPQALLVAGPGTAPFRFTGSGLVTLVDETTTDVTHVETLTYRAGGDVRDSDTFATKGALFCRVRIAPDLPEVDIVSTHLFAGGDLFPIPGANDASRHHHVRMGQVDELVAFVDGVRRPTNPLLVVGDFNVAADDPDPSLADPSDRYDDLRLRMASLGATDVWADHGVGRGPTCTFAAAEELPRDPDEPDQVADDPSGDGAGERIDYLWFSPPTEGDLAVSVDRPRRWAFPGRGVRGGPAGSLSDHLALSVTLHLSPS
ncbi:MAG: endonuclease/exonuclease/phosphatase family protein [Actinobacteria bacterium]|nr:endonuclease/exonuclease/phosphatase family protein [Actinomycetota bacterium]